MSCFKMQLWKYKKIICAICICSIPIKSRPKYNIHMEGDMGWKNTIPPFLIGICV